MKGPRKQSVEKKPATGLRVPASYSSPSALHSSSRVGANLTAATGTLHRKDAAGLDIRADAGAVSGQEIMTKLSQMYKASQHKNGT
jgi:hypothetical protein